VTKRDVRAMRALVAAAQQRGSYRAEPSEADLNIVAPVKAASPSAELDAPVGDSPIPAVRDAPVAAPSLECMDILYVGAPRLSEKLLSAFEVELRRALQHACEPGRQRGFKEVLRELEETNADLAGELQRQLWAQFAQLFEVHADNGGSHFAPMSLSDAPMMQTMFLSAELSIAEVIVALESHLSARVFEFEKRFSNLCNRPLHRLNNPIGIERICRVCHDFLLDRFPQSSLKEPLSAALREGLKAPLNELYGALIAVMTAHDAEGEVAPAASAAAQR